MHSMTRIALLAGSLVLLQGCSDSDDDPVVPPATVADDAVAADGSPLQTVPDDGVGGAAGDDADAVGDGATDVTGTGGVGGTPDVAGVDDGPVAGTTPTTATAGADGLASIAGLYDASYEEEGARDEIYIEILIDGTYTEYDYDGDDFDGGENCYFIETARLVPLGGDSYRLTGDGFGEQEGTLVRSDGALLVTSTDGSESFSESWPLVTNLSSTDFNEC